MILPYACILILTRNGIWLYGIFLGLIEFIKKVILNRCLDKKRVEEVIDKKLRVNNCNEVSADSSQP